MRSLQGPKGHRRIRHLKVLAVKRHTPAFEGHVENIQSFHEAVVGVGKIGPKPPALMNLGARPDPDI